MRKVIMTSMLMAFGLIFMGCVSMQTWPDYERTAESKMVAVQEKIGDGLKNGALTADQSQMHLTTLKGIRTDYVALKNQKVSQSSWYSIVGRLDTLDEKIDKALNASTKAVAPSNGDKIVELQRRIDDTKMVGLLVSPQAEEYQGKLDSIRRDYLRMTEEGKATSYEQKMEISNRLESLGAELNRTK